MMKDNDWDGFAIALAWPETFCKQAGGWYDSLMTGLGFNQNGFYKAGHAAIVLVHNSSGQCYYFDFGRYHAPFAHGRVRSADTDPELKINTVADVNGEGIINLKSILNELSRRKACHGDGDLYASFCRVKFNEVMQKAILLQKKSPLPYGPFQYKGTNCSRFVQSVILAGSPPLNDYLKLCLPYTLTPSPLTNVKALNGMTQIRVGSTKKNLICEHPGTVLPSPPIPGNIPSGAGWLAGEGAGSWFYIIKRFNYYAISRYREEGDLEFESEYIIVNSARFDPAQKFEIIYPSHYQVISILQDHRVIKFERNPEVKYLKDEGEFADSALLKVSKIS